MRKGWVNGKRELGEGGGNKGSPDEPNHLHLPRRLVARHFNRPGALLCRALALCRLQVARQVCALIYRALTLCRFQVRCSN